MKPLLTIPLLLFCLNGFGQSKVEIAKDSVRSWISGQLPDSVETYQEIEWYGFDSTMHYKDECKPLVEKIAACAAEMAAIAAINSTLNPKQQDNSIICNIDSLENELKKHEDGIAAYYITCEYSY